MKPIYALVLLVVIAASACRTRREVPPFEVSSITLVVTQPSIAPEYRTDRRWTLRPTHDPEWDARLKGFLDDTTVNGEVTLREHIGMWIARDKAGLEAVQASAPARTPEATGGSYAELTIWGPQGKLYEFESHYDYSNGAYTRIREWAVARGELTESSPVLPGPGPDADDVD